MSRIIDGPEVELISYAMYCHEAQRGRLAAPMSREEYDDLRRHQGWMPLSNDKKARAALSALEEAGYVIVPREPTEDMLWAGHDEGDSQDPETDYAAAWRAMCDAARKGDEMTEPTPDEAAGMAWWNSLDERQRAYWLHVAASARPADAWRAFKRRRPDDSA